MTIRLFGTLDEELKVFELRYAWRMLAESGWDPPAAAKLCRMSRSGFYRLMKRCGIYRYHWKRRRGNGKGSAPIS